MILGTVGLIITLVLGLLTAPLAADAQHPSNLRGRVASYVAKLLKGAKPGDRASRRR